MTTGKGDHLRKLLEVLPDLRLSDRLTMLFEPVICEKVVTGKDRRHITIYIVSDHIILYDDLAEAAGEISRQLFGKKIHVDIVMSCRLSDAYTAENIFSGCERSITEELALTSPVLADLLRRSMKHFDSPDHLVLEIEKNTIIEIKMRELKAWLENLFKERYDRHLKVTVTYKDSIKKGPEAYQDDPLKKQIRQILDDYETAKKQQPEAAENNKAEKRKTFQDKGRYLKKKLPDDPALFYGRNFEGDDIPISHILGQNEEVIIRGMITESEVREIKKRNDKSILHFSVTDFSDTISATLFVNNDKLPDLLSNMKKGSFVRLKAIAAYDNFSREIALNSINGIKTIPDYTEKRMDNSPEKRVELHCHTTMSDMDGVTDVKDLLKTAMRWGHKAMAITDHGVVQAFTDAYHCVQGTDFKAIYSCEGYLVDDTKTIVTDSKGQSLDGDFTVFDIETTGFSAENDRIIEIGAVIVQNGVVVDRYDEFVNPEVPIPYRITKLTTITDNMVKDADTIDKVLPRFLEFSRGAVMVGHNVTFDISFIAENAKRLGIPFDRVYADTLMISRILLPKLGNHRLDRVAKELGVTLTQHHRAVDDATATGGIWVRLCELMKDQGIEEIGDIKDRLSLPDDAMKHLMPFHVTLLAKNETGRVNLYRLVSMSHVKYFGGTYEQVPRIPKSELIKHREGLIIGSACEAGELYQAALHGASDEELLKIASFYDYLEIQPLGNNRFMVDEGIVSSVEDIKAFNRKIIEIGDRLGKLTVATTDSHYPTPEASVYRNIIMAGIGFKDTMSDSLYLRTTDEMMKEFEYLGSDCL